MTTDARPVAPPYHHGGLRAALLDAAGTILERDGLPALSLRAAARAAGVSHAAPAHHFGDLSGLLSDLAALGFARFRAALMAEMDQAGPAASERLHAMGVGYVRFARTNPQMFLLMFRGERLDPSRPALGEAMHAAFETLSEAASAAAGPTETRSGGADAGLPPDRLADVIAAWGIAHGIAMLLIDGRLRALGDEGNSAALISAALSRLAL